MLSLYFGFSIFSFIASITPGPTNILALNQGHSLGLKLTLAFIVGASFGTGAILLMTALGLSEVIAHFPVIKHIISVVGTSWLSVMAWKLYHTETVSIDNLETAQNRDASITGLKRLKAFDGCALQFVNPKTWMMAITVSSLFPTQVFSQITHYSLLAIIFSLVAIPCISVWALLGVVLKHNAFFLSRLPINKILALLLGISVWWALLYDHI